MREFSEAAESGAGADEIGEALSRALAPVVGHDAIALTGHCPTTGVGPSPFGFWYGLEPGFGQEFLRHYYQGYYQGDLPCMPSELERRPVPAGVLTVGHGPEPCRQMATRLLSPHGVGSQLHLLLRDGRGVWGQLGLTRAEGARPFDAAEVERLHRLAPTLVGHLRDQVTAGPLTPAVPAPPPGVVIVGADHTIRATTPQADDWLERLARCAPGWTVESFLVALAMLTRGHVREFGDAPPPIIGPGVEAGRWIACHGQPLDHDGTGDVSIVIQAATGTRLLPFFGDWYGLTSREREIVAHLYQAQAPKQIARRLDLSVHTVNDHLKAVYGKTGAGGRDELLAAISG
ncbi:LuxR C-terminal-related transcriptional regulator [Actinoallomurus acanthiterrae]